MRDNRSAVGKPVDKVADGHFGSRAGRTLGHCGKRSSPRCRRGPKRGSRLAARRGTATSLRRRAQATEGADVGRGSGRSAVGEAAATATTPNTSRCTSARCKDPDGFWAEMAERLDWMQEADPDQEHLVRRATSASAGTRMASSTSATTASTAISPSAATRPRSCARATTPTSSKKITYRELHEKVCKLANVLKDMGVKKGDRVTIYLPMIPEAAYAMLACARIGAAALGGVRRLLARQPGRPRQRRRVQADHHRRRRPARRPRRAAQGERRQGAGEVPARRQGADVPAHRPVGADGRGPRPGRRRADEDGQRRLPARADERRGPAVPALHLGLDRQAQGRPAHHRRLSGLRRADARIRVRLPRRATSTGARPMSAGSPATATSSTGRSPTAPRR